MAVIVMVVSLTLVCYVGSYLLLSLLLGGYRRTSIWGRSVVGTKALPGGRGYTFEPFLVIHPDYSSGGMQAGRYELLMLPDEAHFLAGDDHGLAVRARHRH